MRKLMILATAGALLVGTVAATETAAAGSGTDAVAAKKKKCKAKGASASKKKKCKAAADPRTLISGKVFARLFANFVNKTTLYETYSFCSTGGMKYVGTLMDVDPESSTVGQSVTTTYTGIWNIISATTDIQTSIQLGLVYGGISAVDSSGQPARPSSLPATLRAITFPQGSSAAFIDSDQFTVGLGAIC